MMRANGPSLWLVVGLVLLAPLVWFGLWQPAQAWKNAQFSALADAGQRSAALAERLETLRREAAAMSAATQFEGVWMADNAGQATARVQAQLSDLARQNGITFRAITPLRTEAIPLKNAVSFRVEAEARLDQVTEFLRAAEYASPVLVFEKGSLRRLSRPGPTTEQPVVFFQFDVLAAYDIGQAQ